MLKYMVNLTVPSSGRWRCVDLVKHMALHLWLLQWSAIPASLCLFCGRRGRDVVI